MSPATLPPKGTDTPATDPLGQPTPLQALLEQMKGSTGFPALSAQIVRVQQVASSENESLHRLTDEILKDVALTNKLLRLVNSVEFTHRSGGGIGTVSRAISLIGFTGIRNLATGLVLLEHMENRSHASQLRSEFLRALFAATLATDLCHTAKERELVFLGALFQSLGRLLAEYYFPEKAQQIRERSQGRWEQEQTLSLQVLGASYENLGLAVAQMWGLPEDMRRLMARPSGTPPGRLSADHMPQRMRWIALAANELTDTLLLHDETSLPAALEQQAKRFAACLGHEVEHITKLTHEARGKLSHTVEAIGLSVPGSNATRRLLQREAAQPAFADSLSQLSDPLPHGNDTPDPASPYPVADILARGVEDVTLAMVEGVPVNDILHSILETIYRALRAQRVLLCLKEASGDAVTGRIGIGHQGTQTARVFRAVLTSADDLFGAICRSGRDTLMRDIQAPQVASRLAPAPLERPHLAPAATAKQRRRPRAHICGHCRTRWRPVAGTGNDPAQNPAQPGCDGHAPVAQLRPSFCPFSAWRTGAVGAKMTPHGPLANRKETACCTDSNAKPPPTW